MSHNINAHIHWLRAKGSFDSVLTVNPEKTFFKFVFQRYSNFSIGDFEISPDRQPQYDGEVRFKVPRIGDLVTQCYLYYNISKLNYGVAQVTVERDSVDADGFTPTHGGVEVTNTKVSGAFQASEYPLTADADYDGITHDTFRPAWIDHLGYVLTQKVELWVGDTLIESHTGDFLHTWDALTRSQEKSVISGLPSDHGGVGNVGTVHDQHIYVPLRFFFCENPGMALPITALQYHDTYIHVKLSAKPLRNDYMNYFERVPYRVPPATDPERFREQKTNIFAGDINTSLVDTGKKLQFANVGGAIQQMRLVARYVFLDDAERQDFAKNNRSFLITETQYLSFPLRKNDKLLKEFVLDRLSGACKEIIFFFRADHRRLEGSDVKNSNWEYWNFEGNRPFPRNDMENKGGYFVRTYGKQMTHLDNAFFESMTFTVNNTDLWTPPRDPLWFNYFVPAEFHSRIPKENQMEMIYVIPFSMNPESDEPSGSVNLSKLDRPSLKFLFSRVPGVKEGAVMADGHLHVYARIMNVFEIRSGHGHRAFLN